MPTVLEKAKRTLDLSTAKERRPDMPVSRHPPQGRLRRLLSHLTPPALEGDVVKLYGAYLLAGMHLTIAMVASLNALNMALDDELAQAAGAVLLAVSVMGLNQGFRRGLPHTLVVRVTLGICLFFVSWVLWETGGIRAGVTAGFMMSLPVAALALRGPREAVWWGGAVVAVLGVFGLAELHPALPQPPPTGQTSLLRVFIAECSLLGFFLGMAYFQYNLSQLQKKQLLDAREAAYAASNAKSMFLANMSHELRTPMNGVLGLTQVLLGSGGLSPEQARTLRTIRSSGQGLVTLLDDILDLSKVEAGRLELEVVPFQPEQLVGRVFALMDEARLAKGLSLRQEVSARGWHVGDPTRIRQVLLNLVGNAIKFTPDGHVVVRVRSADNLLRFEVEDTGIGISAAQQEALWAPFTQADPSTTRRFGGTGLGLTISRRLVELMGGTIDLSSSPGEGSTFGFTVRAAPTTPPMQASPSAPLAPLRPDLRVLVAEDNLINQEVARRMLRQLGIQPTLVSDGAAALAEICAGRWDLVLMDCHMPVMDGLEATRRARAQGATVRIVAMTAGTMPEDREKAAEAGMDDFLPKPIHVEALHALLQAAPRPGHAQRA